MCNPYDGGAGRLNTSPSHSEWSPSTGSPTLFITRFRFCRAVFTSSLASGEVGRIVLSR
jgi:hypothetical protein